MVIFHSYVSLPEGKRIVLENGIEMGKLRTTSEIVPKSQVPVWGFGLVFLGYEKSICCNTCKIDISN